MVGKRGLGKPGHEIHGRGHQNAHHDLESGMRPTTAPAAGRRNPTVKPSLARFRDAARTALEDARRDELKTALLKGVDMDALEKYRKSPDELKRINNKGVRRFYEAQNEHLNDWLEVNAVVTAIADDVLESMNPDPDHDGDQERGGGLQQVAGHVGELLPPDERERRRKAARQASLAININVVANIVLLAGKAFAAFTTGSLSLLASLVDSALDLLCTLIIWSTNKLVLWRLNALQKRFPVGKRRLEPIGILVFSIIMVISFLQILEESVQRMMPPHAQIEVLSTVAIVSLVATIVIKGAIGLICLPIKTSQVQALVQDCKTDVIFNTMSLLFPVIGYKAGIWWLDPVGAALLSLFIIYDWGHTCFENVVRLSGEAVNARVYRKLTYLAYRFSPVVEGIKSITAYHAGDGVWAEFDILLPEQARLNRSHDVSETLQYCAEGLAEVDRAFVSTDYAMIGPTGHAADSEWNH
ncbi:Cation efflux protein [Moelleriella libera RCEF 2490]|uniref:Cation efflux protein n=1 Tax=Moelleriella libera RCEF 2490 TaxID=1081109 RepID=A0A168ASN9_9HYPO|nr:Cation efflux protein [Moelleriella libera RCEF 2490]